MIRVLTPDTNHAIMGVPLGSTNNADHKFYNKRYINENATNKKLLVYTKLLHSCVRRTNHTTHWF